MNDTNNYLVKLDFGSYGSVNVSPEVAMRFISDQKVKDQIRSQCREVIKVVDVYHDDITGYPIGEKTPVISA